MFISRWYLGIYSHVAGQERFVAGLQYTDSPQWPGKRQRITDIEPKKLRAFRERSASRARDGARGHDPRRFPPGVRLFKAPTVACPSSAMSGRA